VARRPVIFALELEELTGRPREHLEFTLWFLTQKRYVVQDENSRLQLTVEGAEYLEQNYRVRQHQRRLRSSNQPDEQGEGAKTQA
jgi:hypothetical protein